MTRDTDDHGAESRPPSSLDPDEKARLIATSFEVDRMYAGALDRLREDFEKRGIDVASPEGRRLFVQAVRELNSRFV